MPTSHRYLTKGGNYFFDRRDSGPQLRIGRAFYSDFTPQTRINTYGNVAAGSFLEGQLPHAGGDWYSVLTAARGLTLVHPEERVNGSLCRVVEADTPVGSYRLWVDRQSGWAVRRALVRVGKDDLYFGQPMRTNFIVLPKGEVPGMEGKIGIQSYECEITDVHIERIGDWYFPAAGTLVQRTVYDGAPPAVSKTVVRRTNVRLGEKAIGPRALEVDWPVGTPVRGMGRYQGISYEWSGSDLKPTVDNPSLQRIADVAFKVRRMRGDHSVSPPKAPLLVPSPLAAPPPTQQSSVLTPHLPAPPLVPVAPARDARLPKTRALAVALGVGLVGWCSWRLLRAKGTRRKPYE
jgi:hypothetical protein